MADPTAPPSMSMSLPEIMAWYGGTSGMGGMDPSLYMDPRKRMQMSMAQQMMQDSVSGTPLRSPFQGLARLAGAISGSMTMNDLKSGTQAQDPNAAANQQKMFDRYRDMLNPKAQAYWDTLDAPKKLTVLASKSADTFGSQTNIGGQQAQMGGLMPTQAQQALAAFRQGQRLPADRQALSESMPSGWTVAFDANGEPYAYPVSGGKESTGYKGAAAQATAAGTSAGNLPYQEALAKYNQGLDIGKSLATDTIEVQTFGPDGTNLGKTTMTKGQYLGQGGSASGSGPIPGGGHYLASPAGGGAPGGGAVATAPGSVAPPAGGSASTGAPTPQDARLNAPATPPATPVTPLPASPAAASTLPPPTPPSQAPTGAPPTAPPPSTAPATALPPPPAGPGPGGPGAPPAPPPYMGGFGGKDAAGNIPQRRFAAPAGPTPFGTPPMVAPPPRPAPSAATTPGTPPLILTPPPASFAKNVPPVPAPGAAPAQGAGAGSAPSNALLAGVLAGEQTPAGAVGKAGERTAYQVTAGAAKDVGLPPPKTEAEGAAIADRYMQKQMATFKNPSVAFVAYNMGPGATANWINRTGGDESKLPPAVRAYANRAMTAYTNALGGAPGTAPGQITTQPLPPPAGGGATSQAAAADLAASVAAEPPITPPAAAGGGGPGGRGALPIQFPAPAAGGAGDAGAAGGAQAGGGGAAGPATVIPPSPPPPVQPTVAAPTAPTTPIGKDYSDDFGGQRAIQDRMALNRTGTVPPRDPTVDGHVAADQKTVDAAKAGALQSQQVEQAGDMITRYLPEAAAGWNAESQNKAAAMFRKWNVPEWFTQGFLQTNPNNAEVLTKEFNVIAAAQANAQSSNAYAMAEDIKQANPHIDMGKAPIELMTNVTKANAQYQQARADAQSRWAGTQQAGIPNTGQYHGLDGWTDPDGTKHPGFVDWADKHIPQKDFETLALAITDPKPFGDAMKNVWPKDGPAVARISKLIAQMPVGTPFWGPDGTPLQVTPEMKAAAGG